MTLDEAREVLAEWEKFPRDTYAAALGKALRVALAEVDRLEAESFPEGGWWDT